MQYPCSFERWVLERMRAMPKLSEKSRAILETCEPQIQHVMNKAIKVVDFVVFEGRRSRERQNSLFSEGKSKVQWPHSYHNVLQPEDLAYAVDAAPWYPENHGIDWRTDHALWNAVQGQQFDLAREILENIKRWHVFVGVVLGIAHAEGIEMINGSDWDKDWRFNDHLFVDSPHFQTRRQF